MFDHRGAGTGASWRARWATRPDASCPSRRSCADCAQRAIRPDCPRSRIVRVGRRGSARDLCGTGRPSRSRSRAGDPRGRTRRAGGRGTTDHARCGGGDGVNPLLRRLGDDAAPVQHAVFLQLADPMVAEICAGAGFELVVIDTEHGPSGITDVISQLQAIAAGDTDGAVRVADHNPASIKRVLDAGRPRSSCRWSTNQSRRRR